ncbi:hypothetical protein AGR4B_Lc70145 [Agrobacterium tumefaciens str. CFBP 5621]|nr:hypothetical protein AGR4B_Lc70145 [Agrobacterium tumefaciens str. CFBP 5621]
MLVSPDGGHELMTKCGLRRGLRILLGPHGGLGSKIYAEVTG